MGKGSDRRLKLLAIVGMLGVSVSFARDHSRSTLAHRIRHVFVIVLENKSFDDTFVTSSQDPYLKKTLVPMGALLTQYYGTGHVSLDNYISMISGQAPTRDTANDCLSGSNGPIGNYIDVEQVGTTEDGQVIAPRGCIYPTHVKTLADQLHGAGFTWRAYMEDMGNDSARESTTCGHPRLGVATDNTNAPEAPSATVPQGDAYATRHNPFMYFHSIIDSPDCNTNVVNLRNLGIDLAHKSSTPNFVFITPNLCHDGHDGDGTGEKGTTCANEEPGGLTSADTFLKTWVPRILGSAAYKDDGLLIITFDESDSTVSEGKDVNTGRSTIVIDFPGRVCCNQQPGPNLDGQRPGRFTLVNTPSLIETVVMHGYGGDRIGTLLLSPFAKPGSTSDTPYNHYSLLRSIENIFGLVGHLGYAADNPSKRYYLDTLDNDTTVFQLDPVRSAPSRETSNVLPANPSLEIRTSGDDP